MEELERLKNKIIELYSPSKIIFFGSRAKKCIDIAEEVLNAVLEDIKK